MNENSKRFLILVSVIIFISLLASVSFATDQNEIDEIKDILNNEENFIVTESNGINIDEVLLDDYNIDKATKVWFSKTLMLTAYEETNTVDSIVSEKYQWCIPLGEDEQNVAIFSISDERMVLSGTRPSIGYYLSDDEIGRIIVNNKIEISTINSIKRIFSPMYYTMFTIVETDSVTYCIPFSSNTEFVCLENKKLYIFEDMMQILIKRFDESKLLEQADSYGGVPLRENNSLWLLLIIILSAISIVVCSVLLFKTKKKEELSK